MNSHCSNHLDGRWQLLRAKLNGEDAPPLITSNTQIVFIDGRYHVVFGDQIVESGVFTSDTAFHVRTLMLHSTEGTHRGRNIPCIYRYAGELLQICYGLDGVTPTTFRAVVGENRYLAIYRGLAGKLHLASAPCSTSNR